MLKKIVLSAATLAALLTAAVQTPALAGGGGGGGSGGGGGGEYRLRANMAAGRASGKSVYRERLRNNVLQQRWNVEIEDLAANTTFDVLVNGNLFGTITTNNLGTAELEFATFIVDNNPHDEEPPIPTDFPHLVAGDTITVGPLSGTFQ